MTVPHCITSLTQTRSRVECRTSPLRICMFSYYLLLRFCFFRILGWVARLATCAASLHPLQDGSTLHSSWQECLGQFP